MTLARLLDTTCHTTVRTDPIEFPSRPASAAPASGFLLTAVSKANSWGRGQPEPSCRSLPIQHVTRT